MSIDQKPPGPGEPDQWTEKPTVVERPALLEQPHAGQPVSPFQSPTAMTPPTGASPMGQSPHTPAPLAQQAPAVAVMPTDTAPSGMEAADEDEMGRWVEEGLWWQGSTPPQSDEWDDRDWIEIPHEHYIPISKSRLVGALWKFQKAQQAGTHFKHFIELVEAVYHFHYHQTLNELKEDYEYFSPDAGEERRNGVSEEELLWREQRFVSNFVKTMIRGNFIPFQEDDRERAKEQNYLFDLAVDVKWDIYDNQLIENFLNAADSDTDEGRAIREDLEVDDSIREFLSIPKEFDNRMMLFYRGISRDQTSGMFVMQKVDHFLNKFLGLAIWPVQWLLNRIRGHEEEPGELKGLDEMKSLLGMSTEEKKAVKVEDLAEEDDRAVIFDRRWVRRVNIGNSKLAFGDLVKTSHLQEPTLERMLCVFRLLPPQPPKVLDRVPFLKKIVEKVMGKKEDEGRDWTIFIKMFKNIPLADSDIVFPEKKVRMKSFDVAMLSLVGFVGVIALIEGMRSGGKALIAVVAILASYAVKVVLGYFRARAKYMARMTKELYHKSLDNDLGVLQYLVDALEEQEVKEATMAYFFLWNEGRPMTEEELDGRIEAFIHEHFDGLELDFECDDALDKVIEKEGPQPHKHMPIVIVHEGAGPNGEDLYEAKPIEEALRIIDEKWDNFYEYN